MNLRKARLADEIRDVIANCFLSDKMQDPRLSGITITDVRLTGDLQIATVYYRVFGSVPKEKAHSGLEHVKGFLRKKLADTLEIRRVPQLRFYYDESIENAERIEKLITQIKEE